MESAQQQMYRQQQEIESLKRKLNQTTYRIELLTTNLRALRDAQDKLADKLRR